MQLTVTFTVEDVADVLRMWMLDARLSTRALAERVTDLLPGEKSVSYMAVQRYLGGRWPTGVPDLAVVAAMTRAMGHSIDELPQDVRAAMEELRGLLAAPASKPKSPTRKRVSSGRPRSNGRSARAKSAMIPYAPSGPGFPWSAAA